MVFQLLLALRRLVRLSKRKIIETSFSAFIGFPFAIVFRCTLSFLLKSSFKALTNVFEGQIFSCLITANRIRPASLFGKERLKSKHSMKLVWVYRSCHNVFISNMSIPRSSSSSQARQAKHTSLVAIFSKAHHTFPNTRPEDNKEPVIRPSTNQRSKFTKLATRISVQLKYIVHWAV